MEAFFVSTVSVALAEIGDKTQLLALVLAARFRRPWPVLAGMLLATLVNHSIAAQLGAWLTSMLSPQTLRWTVALSFIAVGLWILVPDRDGDKPAGYAHGAFLTTLVTFFLAEIGDKTQLATVVLAAGYDEIAAVVLGTTAGMMLANVPVVFAGSFAGHKIPLKLIRALAAATFVALGVIALVGNFD
ncbi:MAG: TMEM165/GDT1 family protein [Woeseiaceae bacterium]